MSTFDEAAPNRDELMALARDDLVIARMHAGEILRRLDELPVAEREPALRGLVEILIAGVERVISVTAPEPLTLQGDDLLTLQDGATPLLLFPVQERPSG